MKITGFVGPAGTGKSHHATVVAYEHNIDCIIDDGILIYQNRIVAGRSAKDETNQLKATRCAVFMDKKHAADVKKALNKIAPAQLLVLGTSEHMIKRILQSLDLPPVSEYIRIEDVSTPREIATARNVRSTEGKHVIPVPTMELKPHFRGYLLDPIRSFFHKKSGGADLDSFERSVVRPVFSYYGKLTFTDEALRSLILHGLKGIHGIKAVNKVKINKSSTTAGNGIVISLAVTVLYGENLKKLMRHVKDTIQQEIEYTTGMSVDVLKVTIRGVVKK
jgi:uncharacterized alkaline shock family protein YloU